MSDSKAIALENLQSLRDHYAENLEGRLASIREKWVAFKVRPGDQEHLEALHREVHALNGSSATFGYHEISHKARELEQLLAAVRKGAISLDGDREKTLENMLEALTRTVQTTRRDAPSPPSTLSEPRLCESSRSPTRRIYLLEDDVDLGQNLSLQIGHFGYSVDAFTTVADIREAVKQEAPEAIIMDVVLCEGELAGIAAAQTIREEMSRRIPVVFISSRSDLTARLEAVRAGADAYFTKPVEIVHLIDRLESLLSKEAPEPYRVFIVDDDRSLTEFYALTLEEAGMVTCTVNDPLQVMEPLKSFVPDLILMDVYMPGCSGLELAAVIRQEESWVGIPIVYLSAERNPHKQIAAMRLGGDDFLTKDIDPDYLISSVTARVQRLRTLRSFITRDHLTGLYNYNALWDQLQLEEERARRHGDDLAFAMIDLDRLKSINDTHGHSTGTRVIKSLARLLQQRLRKSDSIGRYGGDEFFVVLPGADLEGAFRRINDIRETWAKVIHQSEKGTISATLSAGVAGLHGFDSAIELFEAADQALYAAKNGGRNQIARAPALTRAPACTSQLTAEP